MNERIRYLVEQTVKSVDIVTGNEILDDELDKMYIPDCFAEKFAQLIAGECAEICLEMAAKCAGLPGDGALAKDCAYWIKKDFGVEE